jgi:hypothetical protein
MAKAQVKKHFDAPLDFEGAQITIHVKRMKLEEFLEFERSYTEYGRPMPGADEATKEEIEARALRFIAWLRETFRAYLTVPAGELDDEHGNPVLTGEELFDACGAQNDVRMDAVNQIFAQNRFPEDLRKKFWSPSGSATTSGAPEKGPDGPKLDQTAGDAAPSSSAASGDAPAAPSSPAPSLSGVTSE